MIFEKVYLCVILILFNGAAGEEKYAASIMGMTECTDVKNECMQCNDMKMKISDDGKDVEMEGCLEMLTDITDDCKMQLSILKESEAGCEPMMSIASDFCTALEDESAPWSDMCQSMNVTSCPVKTGKYCMSNMKINLDSTESFMTHEYCGDYIIIMEILCPATVCACFKMGMSIEEV